MSRKRVSAVALLETEYVCQPESEEYARNYLPPGCYSTPQVEHSQDCMIPSCNAFAWSAPLCCTTATYVVDTYGRTYYRSDVEQSFQTVSSMVTHIPSYESSQSGCSCIQHRDFEIPLMPHINEEDYYDPPESLRKRERFEEEDCHEHEADYQESFELSQNDQSLGNTNIYRSKEGYLVEEPVDATEETKPQKKKRKKPSRRRNK